MDYSPWNHRESDMTEQLTQNAITKTLRNMEMQKTAFTYCVFIELGERQEISMT